MELNVKSSNFIPEVDENQFSKRNAKVRPSFQERSLTFIPNLCKQNNSKPTVVVKDDPFITGESLNAYCSLFTSRDDGLPDYMGIYKDFVDNVTDFSQSIWDDINKVQIERENEMREREREKAKKAAEQEAHELSIKNALDKRVNTVIKDTKFYIKRSCPVRIPFKSTLTHDEHEAYVRAFIKFQMRPPATALEKLEHEKYLQLQNRVFDEQSCLMNFSFQVSQLILKNYNEVPATMENYIRDYVLHRCQRALAYPRFYRSEMEIPLKPHSSNNFSSNFQFRHLGHLLSLGWVPHLKPPSKQFKVDLPKDDTLHCAKPPNCDGRFNRKAFLYKCPVSEDPNAEFLAKEHGVSIVISASAFKTIVDNQEQPFDKDWNIPVRIKSHTVKGADGKEQKLRVVYIDKPLPKKSWLPLEKKFTFFKKAALLICSKYVNKQFFKMPLIFKMTNDDPRTSTNKIVYDDSIYDPLSVNTVETFGAECEPDNDKQKGDKNRNSLNDTVESDLYLSDEADDINSRSLHEKKSCNPLKHNVVIKENKRSSGNATVNVNKRFKNKNTTQSSTISTTQSSTISPYSNVSDGKTTSPDISDGGFLDDLLHKQDGLLKPKCVSSNDHLNASGSMISDIITGHHHHHHHHLKPWSDTLSSDWTKFQVKKCPRGIGTNVHYQLFSFESSENNSSAKHQVTEPIRVLVRHNLHGLSWTKGVPEDSKAYVVYPKIENQVYFGCEVNSLSEITEQWASLVIRPNTTLMQVRICVESGSVMMSEERTLESVLKEGKQSHINFQAQSAFAVLNALFNIVVKMESGNYVLHHSVNTGAFIKLLKEETSEDPSHQPIFDLHKVYTDDTVTSRIYKTAPWLAIDTHVLTPFHKYHKKIPATFPMENPNLKLNKKQRKMKTAKAKAKLGIKDIE